MTFDDRDVTPIHAEGEILERVHARGTTLRRRKVLARAVSGGMVAAVLLAGGIAIAYQGGPKKPVSGGFVNSAAPTVSETPSDNPSEGPTGTPTEEPLSSDTPSEHPSPSASATLVCLNSYDSACGKFYWEPAPGANAPMTVTMHVSSNTLTVGETVTVTATAVDPDAPIMCHYIDWGPTYIGTAVQRRSRYGPWKTPEKTRGEETPTFTHQYQTAGTYHIDFYSVSGASCLDSTASPYSSGDRASVTVTVVYGTPTPSPSVSESPSPSPSPSLS